MSGPALVLRCPHCGADVEVASGRALVVTCGHCSTLLRRTDVDLAVIEQVAWVVPLASRFQRGTTGRHDGVGFVVRGQVQLDHGAGPWNEWAAERADGRWLWIAEAQGELLVMEERPLTGGDLDVAREAAAGFPGDAADGARPVRAGQVLALDGRRWTVTEVGRGAVVSCAGELPIDPQVGGQTRYLDLAEGGRRVATLDLTRPEPEWLAGERVDERDLALDPSSQPEHTPARVTARRIRCPHCDGELTVQDPEHALRIGCEHCESVLERRPLEGHAGGAADEATLLYDAVLAQKRVEARSPLPLGATGALLGERVTVLGAMQRRVKSDGRWYPWREVLLRTDGGGYRWLVESDGHWSYARPVSPAAVQVRGGVARLGSRRFKHFTGGKAVVHWVVGEFYWRVEKGDEVRADDYVNVRAGRAVSVERTDAELVASEAVHVPSDSVAAAFGARWLPAERSVGMLSPNPARPREALLIAVAAVAALIALFVVSLARHAKEEVYAANLGPTPATPGEERVDFSPPFELTRGPANLRVRLRAPSVNQGWLGLTGALVDVATGEVTTFATEAQYYSGRSGGESWSEGNRRGTSWLGSVRAGTYRLRLAVQGWDQGVGQPYSVIVHSQVPRPLWFFLFLVPLLLLPLGSFLRWVTFESRRWQESDHPWAESE